MVFGFSYGLFPIVFLIILAAFIYVLVHGIHTWNKNNHSPRLSVHAKVTAKRQKFTQSSQPVAGDLTGAHGFQTMGRTDYFATFQFESGDRTEFHISAREYAMLAEGDEGILTFQGTRYLSFDR